MLSFRDLKDGYERNWSNLEIRPERAAEVRREANLLLQGKSIYQQIEARTGMKWFFVGLCHYRESHYDFNTYLGNGQPLGRVTTIVPKGRGPFAGPQAFVDGAVDAFRLEGFLGASDWSIGRMLYRLEGFNGYGYHSQGVNSPYLYGGSTLYGPPEARGGKYVRDHVFDRNKVDTQLGTAVILKDLLELDHTIDLGGVSSEVSLVPDISTETIPEPDEELARTVLQVQQSLNELGANPRLVEDGKNGPKTMAAISQFQQQNGLDDTGLPDAATIAAIAQKTSQPIGQPIAPAPDPILEVLQRLSSLQNTLQSSTDPSKLPNDPVGLVERLLAIVQKTQPKPQMTPSAVPSPNVDQLQKAMSLLSAVLGPGKDGKPPLGGVNGALGDTIGNMLNGKKTALGIGGALLTSLLGQVPAATGLGQVLGNLTPALGLSQFAMPVFLALTAWGFLGKLEKWTQGTAPPQPQS
jgi:lysozyme family protein/peptidoglycan hydrolase-like protein with peptidoglycan-binding domain